MDSESRKLFGQRIKDRRLKLGLSQLELAQNIHKSSAAYIAFIESGERNISTMDMMLLAKSLDTSVSDLLGESDSKTSVLMALRADSTLSESDKRALMSIYRTLKEKHENR